MGSAGDCTDNDHNRLSNSSPLAKHNDEPSSLDALLKQQHQQATQVELGVDEIQLHLRHNAKKSSEVERDESAKPIDNATIHTFEDVLCMLNSNGRWQLCIMLICLVTSIALQVSNYAQGIFFVGKLDHSCMHFDDENDVSQFSSNTTSESFLAWSTGGDRLDGVHARACASPSTGARCRAWNYSSPYYGHTMQSEWNLVCEQSYKIPLFQSSYLIGYLIGMPLFGAVADLYGRRIVIMIAWPLLVASYIATALSPSYWLVAVMRALQGLLSGGDWKTKYVLTMEVTSIERRNFVSVMIGSCFPLAALTATALAWFIRDWRYLQLASVGPVLLVLPLLFFVPESPRWLITHSRFVEAQRTLEQAARFNGRKLPPNLDLKRLHDLHGDDDDQDEVETTKMPDVVLATAETKRFKISWRSRFRNLFATKKMRTRSYVLFVQWFVVELVFNGAMFYGTGVMPGNPYLVLIAMSIMRLLNNPIQIYLFNRIGVRNAHVILLMAAALSCGALGALPASWTTGVNALGIALLVAGNCFSDACSGALDILTTEAYPTTIRQTGVGVCSMWAQVGAGISPFIAESLSVYWQPLPATVFSSICFIAALVIVLWFPTVEHAALPDTLQDTEFTTQVSGDKKAIPANEQMQQSCENGKSYI